MTRLVVWFGMLTAFAAQQIVLDLEVLLVAGVVHRFVAFLAVVIASLLGFIPGCVRFAQEADDDACYV